jgi:hypothetical protein
MPETAAGLARKIKKIAKNKWIYLPKKIASPYPYYLDGGGKEFGNLISASL